MAINYPTSLDDTTSLPTRTTGDTIPVLDTNDPKSAIIQLETKLGTGASTPTTSGHVLRVTGAGATAYGAVAQADVTNLTTDLAAKVPTTRTVNSHALSADISLTASDVGAVPTTRTVNGHALSANVTVSGADLGMSDVTTNNVSITQHGFAPKAPNDATKYLDGTGAWSVPAGGGGGSSKPRDSISFVFENISGYQTASYGTSASVTFDSYGAYLARGTQTDGGASVTDGRSPTAYSIFDKNPIYSFTMNADGVGSSTEWKCYSVLGTVGSASSVTPTSAHVGFAIHDNLGSHEIICTNANGTAETTTVSTAYNISNFNHFTAVVTSGVNIKYYVNGTLIATHTTNLPSGYAQNLTCNMMKGISGSGNNARVESASLSYDVY